MDNFKVILADKSDVQFDNDELGGIYGWAEKHSENCPNIRQDGVSYVIKTFREGEKVNVIKYAVCGACEMRFYVNQFTF